jgi:triphosphoribosyl-dephospho-CoA synthase
MLPDASDYKMTQMPNAANPRHALMACLLEATARKPGNVHPEAAFVDLTYQDFVRSAYLAAPAFEQATERGVGRIVLDAVERTHRALGRNTNLGIALLLAPLACVQETVPLQAGIHDALAQLSRDDAASVYAAILLAKPGGLGRVDREDVASPPSVTLLEAMRMAADRDSVAAQYATDFATVFAGVERLARVERFTERWEEAVIDLHLWLMSEFPDTLIARKCGADVARESARRARAVLECGWPAASARENFVELDKWLRGDGNRRNPGTTADLVAACLFAGFRDGQLDAPPIPNAAIALVSQSLCE